MIDPTPLQAAAIVRAISAAHCDGFRSQGVLDLVLALIEIARSASPPLQYIDDLERAIERFEDVV